jgi:gamma-glutamyltranspeptidase / glutathione hydrolase
MFLRTFRLISVILVLILISVTNTGCDSLNGDSEGMNDSNGNEVSRENEDIQINEEEPPAASPEVTRTDHVVAVVSAHRIATEAGNEILAAGGTAADAAVAVAAALTVVEPYFSSVFGGGTWALYYDASTGEVTSLDGVGPVGSHATVEDYAARGAQSGMHQAVVPGAWDGWMIWLDTYGRLDLDEVLAPAVRAAREGYPVSSSMSTWLNRNSEEISHLTDTAQIYMPEGRLLSEGETVYQNGLADTFDAVVDVYNSMIDEGRSEALQAARDYFYRGPLAEVIVDFSDEHGGYLTLEDFHQFEAAIVEAISIHYDEGIEVYQNPPNSQGITMLLALNILKGFDFSELGPDDPDAIHLQVEALKLAFADRHYHIGDPDRIDIPLDQLLSDEYADSQRERIDMDSAMRWPIEDGLEGDPDMSNTTTFHIVDRYGNGAAVTTSLGAQFMVVGDTGIHINNRMRMLSLEENNPNLLTPGYKVRHTSNPYMALKNERPFILGGNIGADNQPQGQVQQFMHIVEFGLTAQEAVDRRRFATTAFPAGTFPHGIDNTLRMQSGFAPEVVSALRSKGHNVAEGGAFGSAFAIVIGGDGYDAETGADSRVSTAYGIVNSSQEESLSD